MKIERKTRTSSEISTSSMPDIIFMLLIFFMVTTVMREYEGLDVIMPRAKMIEKLEIGMTESQVKYIMGTPLINDTFIPNRWDYFTSISQGENVFSETKVTLFFEEGKLVKWEGDIPSLE